MMKSGIARRFAASAGVLVLTLCLAQSAYSQAVGDPAPVVPGQGLLGTYYNNTGAAGAGLGPPPVPPPGSPIGTPNGGLSVQFLQRLDATVNFDFQATPPPGVNNTPGTCDHVTFVWTGFVIAGAAGSYSFAVGADDGMRCWINDLTANPPPMDIWGQGGDRPSNTVILAGITAGQRIPIRFEMYEHEGGAAARLRWSPTGAATADTIIPQTNLAPPDGPAAPTISSATAPPGATAQVSLTWSAPVGATGYILSRQVGAGPMQVLALVAGNTYDDLAVTFGSSYTYIVQATSNTGVSIGLPSTSQTVTTPTISASPATGLQTNENGATTAFNISLNAALTAGNSVTITVTSNNAGEGQVSGGGQAQATSINFIVSGPQIAGFLIPITVIGIDDLVADGPVPYTISVTATSTQANLMGQTIPNVQVTNNDNDIPGFTVSTTSVSVGENGGTANFLILLNTLPTGNVVVNLVSSDPTQVTVTTPVTLTTGNWNTGVTVTVTGVDDTVIETNRVYSITTSVDTAATADLLYGVLDPSDVVVTVIDDEVIPDADDAWGCGALGIEAWGVLALLALLRRRKV